MIKFHYHRARTPVPRLGIEQGDRLCHVYSDRSREELEAWGRRHGWKPSWIHDGSIPHFDAFGERLAACGAGVSGREFAGDIRRWRERDQ